jgi:hypothetical protein
MSSFFRLVSRFLVSALALSAGAGPIGPFSNGSFESDLTAWTATGNVRVVSGSFWVATDGVKAVAFNAGQSTPNGVLSQTFATTAGQSYTLAFDVGASSGLNHDTMTIQATVQGQSPSPLLQQTASIAAPGSGTTYVTRTFTFTADASSATLTFADQSATTQNVDLMLDNVKVTASGVTTTSMGPLTVSSTNSRYFVDGGGNPVYLTGSHTWNNLQDVANLGTFDFNAYLNFLSANHFNFIRLWQLDRLQLNLLGQPPLSPVSPAPFVRTGPGVAGDGGLKLDLNQLNQAFFDRLAQRVAAAQSKGLYVGIMLFDPLWVTSNPSLYWPVAYFNPANTVNNITVTPDQVYTNANAALLTIQQNYIRKVIDTVNGFDNVLYEIGNEPASASKTWEYSLIDYIHAYEATKPKQHPVGMTAFNGPAGEAANVDLYNSPADWVSPWGGVSYRDNMPAAPGGRVTILDTDHVWGYDPPGDDSAWFWKAFLRGHNPILMDANGDAVLSQYQTDPHEYTAMAQTWAYAQKIHLLSDTPNGGLASTGYALANPGQEYLVYQPGSGAFTVNLAGGSGTFAVEWFDPATGTTTAGLPVSSGATTTFTPPWSGAAVLYLAAAGSASGSGAFANGSFENDLAGWTATGDVRVVSGSFWVATDGIKAVAFNAGQSAPNGVLSQTFATTAGQTYTLTFDVGATSGLNQDVMAAQVTVQGQALSPLLSQAATVAAPGNGTRYESKSYTFTADSSSVTLTFSDVSATTQNVDLLLDNVRVTSP